MDNKSEFDSSLYRKALAQLDSVAERINLEPDVHERLRYPRRALVVSVPTLMDDGHTEIFIQAARHLGLDLKGRRIMIQGFGNVGSVTARLLWREGCLVVGHRLPRRGHDLQCRAS